MKPNCSLLDSNLVLLADVPITQRDTHNQPGEDVMDKGQLMFKIDATASKLKDTADHIGTLITQLAEQRDDAVSSFKKRVETAELKCRAMAAYLTEVGAHRGKSVEDVLDFFERAVVGHLQPKAPAEKQVEIPVAEVAAEEEPQASEVF